MDLFAKDFVVIPYHQNEHLHWSLFVLCYPNAMLQRLQEWAEEVGGGDQKVEEEGGEGEKAEFGYGGGKAKGKRPFLVYFDSMGVCQERDVEIIYSYLDECLRAQDVELYKKLSAAVKKGKLGTN